MNSDTLIEIIIATVKRRWKLLILLCAIVWPAAVFELRSIEFPYTAQIRLFALPQSSQSLLGNQSSMFMGGNATDRTALLSGQDALVHSTRIFDAVRTVDPDLKKNTSAAGNQSQPFRSLITVFQEHIFGKEYVQTRQRWRDFEFNRFKQRISVDVDLESISISLKYKHTNPQMALIAVKKAADELQVVNTEISKKQSLKKVQFLAEKIAESRRENDEISDQITAFVRKNKVSSDPRTVEPTYRGLSEASEMVTTAKLEIAQRELALEETKKVSARLQAEIKQGLIEDREGHLKSLTDDLRQYEMGMNKLSVRTQSPIRNAVKKQINSVRAKIAQEFAGATNRMDVASLQQLLTMNESSILEQEAALRSAKKQLEFGGEQFKKFERKISDLPEINANLTKLTIVQTQQRKLLEVLTQRFLEAQIESDTKLAQFYVTEEPMLSDTDKLGKLPILLSLLASSTAILIAIVVFWDIKRGIILVKTQLSRFQTPHFIGAVAFEDQLKRRKIHAAILEIGVGFRVFHALKKYLTDASTSNKNGKVIAVTSKSARVGKTVTSLGIATAMQSSGYRTIIIDADYLAQERALRNQGTDGFHVVHSQKDFFESSTLRNAAHHKRQKLSIWNLIGEFQSEAEITQFLLNDFSTTLAKIQESYDCIVIDCAPCFVSSMLLIYEKADINLLCFAEGISTLNDVAHATEVIEPSSKDGAKILSVLTMTHLKSNSLTPRGSDGFYYRNVKAA